MIVTCNSIIMFGYWSISKLVVWPLSNLVRWISTIDKLGRFEEDEGIMSIFEVAGENYQGKGNRCYDSG